MQSEEDMALIDFRKMCVCVFCSAKMPRKERRIKQKKKELLEAGAKKILFHFLNCIMAFATVSIQKHPHQYAYQQGMHHCCYDILCTALFKALFHVPLLYFEHLPLQRSLHGPVQINKQMCFFFLLMTN